MQKNNVKSETNVTKKVIDTNLIIKREMDKTPNTEDEWKAKLTPEEYYVLREKVLNALFQENMKTIINLEFMFVRAAVVNYLSRMQNLMPIADGQVFMKELTKVK